MKFAIIHNGKEINTISAFDADHASDMVSTMYPDNYTEITLNFKGEDDYLDKIVPKKVREQVINENLGPKIVGKITF